MHVSQFVCLMDASSTHPCLGDVRLVSGEPHLLPVPGMDSPGGAISSVIIDVILVSICDIFLAFPAQNELVVMRVPAPGDSSRAGRRRESLASGLIHSY